MKLVFAPFKSIVVGSALPTYVFTILPEFSILLSSIVKSAPAVSLIVLVAVLVRFFPFKSMVNSLLIESALALSILFILIAYAGGVLIGNFPIVIIYCCVVFFVQWFIDMQIVKKLAEKIIDKVINRI